MELLEPVPDGVVVLLQLRQAHRELRRSKDETRLPHECKRVLDLLRFQLGAARALERLHIWSVSRHAVVNRYAARQEAFGLRVIDAVDETHELAHDVAVEPRRP